MLKQSNFNHSKLSTTKLSQLALGLSCAFRHGSGSSSSSSSSSSEEVTVYTPEEAALVEQLFYFLDGLNGFIDGTEDRFFESGEYFTDDGIFCSTGRGCAKSLAEMPSLFGILPALIESIVFVNFKITGVNPSLPIPSITFITDEVAIVAATGCSFLIPSRTGLVYFEGELVSQFHIADSDEQSVFAFFEGFQPNATSCNY